MEKNSSRSVFHGRLQLIVFALTLAFCPKAGGQTNESIDHRPAPERSVAVEEYKIGPDDVLSITVADAPEFSGKHRVSDGGLIEIAGIATPIHADGQSALELSHTIRAALIDAKQMRDPRVNVFIEEYHGRTITVLGAVNKPAVYSLQKRTTILDAISMAGGALPNAGSTVTIVRGRASAEATGKEVGSVQIIDMIRVLKGGDAAANVEVRNEDVLNVSAAQVVYVVGAVTKPGGFAMSNPSEGISVVQAIALAEGLRPVAAARRAVIVRQSTSDQARREIPVDIGQMMSGKQTDVLLGPNDILYIPESGTKKTLKALGEVAMAAVNGIAIYGLGYRVGSL